VLAAGVFLLSQAVATAQVLQPSCSGRLPPPPPPPGSELERAMKNAPLQPAEQSGKWGYTNPQGKFVISPQFDCAERFSEGLAVVEVEERFGYTDSDGHVVIPPKYFAAGIFKDGFAWVMTRKPWMPLGKGEYGFVARLGAGTFIDQLGRELTRPFPIAEVSDFSEGLAAVRPGNMGHGYAGKVGYLNTKGEWSIKPQFDEGRDFSEGLAAVNEGAKGHMGGKWGYVNKDGTLAIPLLYRFAGQFKNGHACVLEAEQWKVIDRNGNGAPVEKNKCFCCN
jgi:hypothetical protein